MPLDAEACYHYPASIETCNLSALREPFSEDAGARSDARSLYKAAGGSPLPSSCATSLDAALSAVMQSSSKPTHRLNLAASSGLASTQAAYRTRRCSLTRNV